VHPEDPVHGEAVEQPFLDHDLAAAAQFLGRLEDDVDGAGEVARLGEVAGRTEQHGGVAVVTAGMHHARVQRRIGQTGLLDDRQGVDVGPEPDRGRPRLASADHADHACAGDAGHHLVDPELSEPVLDRTTGPVFRESQFGMLVQVVTPRRHVGMEIGDAVVDRHGSGVRNFEVIGMPETCRWRECSKFDAAGPAAEARRLTAPRRSWFVAIPSFRIVEAP